MEQWNTRPIEDKLQAEIKRLDTLWEKELNNVKRLQAELDFCTKRMTAKDTEIERLNTIIHNRAEDMELKAENARLKEQIEFLKREPEQLKKVFALIKDDRIAELQAELERHKENARKFLDEKDKALAENLKLQAELEAAPKALPVSVGTSTGRSYRH
jgi:predicted  nucleic acid-binding Zn-ribbon protein